MLGIPEIARLASRIRRGVLTSKARGSRFASCDAASNLSCGRRAPQRQRGRDARELNPQLFACNQVADSRFAVGDVGRHVVGVEEAG